jgi:hypothetical protein
VRFICPWQQPAIPGPAKPLGGPTQSFPFAIARLRDRRRRHLRQALVGLPAIQGVALRRAARCRSAVWARGEERLTSRREPKREL